jgi:hypothetical protein
MAENTTLKELYAGLITAVGGDPGKATTLQELLAELGVALTAFAATGAPAATSVTGPDAFGASSVVGSSGHYARADHNHGLPASTSITSVGTLTALTVSGAVDLTDSSVKMTALPTSDPAVIGALWANSGVVTVSAGP